MRHPGSLAGRVAGVLFLLSIIGCTTLQLPHEGWKESRSYLGWTRIRMEPSETYDGSTPGVRAVEITNIGMGVGDRGFTLGYGHEQRVSTPMDCRFVVLVRHREDVAFIEQRLYALKGERLCIAPFAPD